MCLFPFYSCHYRIWWVKVTSSDCLWSQQTFISEKWDPRNLQHFKVPRHLHSSGIEQNHKKRSGLSRGGFKNFIFNSLTPLSKRGLFLTVRNASLWGHPNLSEIGTSILKEGLFMFQQIFSSVRIKSPSFTLSICDKKELNLTFSPYLLWAPYSCAINVFENIFVE